MPYFSQNICEKIIIIHTPYVLIKMEETFLITNYNWKVQILTQTLIKNLSEHF